MNKLFKLKKWLTLEDAAKRLSSSLDEEVTAKDILQLSLDEEIQISWYMRSSDARQIEYIKEFILVGDDLTYFNENKTLSPKIQEQADSFPSYRKLKITTDPTSLSDDGLDIQTTVRIFDEYIGPYKRGDVYRIKSDTRYFKEAISSLLFNGDFEDKFYGHDIVLLDNENNIFQPVVNESYYSSREINHKMVNVLEGRTLVNSTPPQLKDLVILREDIDLFEQSLLDIDPKINLRTPDESLSIPVIIENA